MLALATSRRETYIYVITILAFEDGRRICTWQRLAKSTAAVYTRFAFY